MGRKDARWRDDDARTTRGRRVRWFLLLLRMRARRAARAARAEAISGRATRESSGGASGHPKASVPSRHREVRRESSQRRRRAHPADEPRRRRTAPPPHARLRRARCGLTGDEIVMLRGGGRRRVVVLSAARFPVARAVSALIYHRQVRWRGVSRSVARADAARRREGTTKAWAGPTALQKGTRDEARGTTTDVGGTALRCRKERGRRSTHKGRRRTWARPRRDGRGLKTGAGPVRAAACTRGVRDGRDRISRAPHRRALGDRER